MTANGAVSTAQTAEDNSENIISPPVWSTTKNFRQSRKGKVLANVSECYLREDLGLGFLTESRLTAKRNGIKVRENGKARRIESSEDLIDVLIKSDSKHGECQKKTYLVILDTNVLLHNLDVLEHSSCSIANIVIPQTTLAECRHRSLGAYGRAMDLLRSGTVSGNDENSGNISKNRCVIFFPDKHDVLTHQTSNIQAHSSSINDRNDRVIRRVTEIYTEALHNSNVEVVLLTDDANCRKLALEEQRSKLDPNKIRNDDKNVNGTSNPSYTPKSVKDHVSDLEKEDPQLSISDLVAQFEVGHTQSDMINTKKNIKNIFSSHLPQNDLSIGLKSGKYFQGRLRVERGSYDRGYVTIRRGEERVAVNLIGTMDTNRAVDGDTVVIQIHPVHKWLGTQSSSNYGTETNDTQQSDTTTRFSEKTPYSVNNPGTCIAAETAEPSIKDEENVIDTLQIEGKSTKDQDESMSMQLKRPTGKVVGITRRNFRKNYCGSLHSILKQNLESVAVKSSDGEDNQKQTISTRNDLIDQHMKKRKLESSTTDQIQNIIHQPQSQTNHSNPKLSPRDSIATAHEIEHTDGSMTCIFFAVDTRVPPIFVRTTQRDRLLNKRILVSIDSWPANSPYPLGHYVKTIGEIGNKDVETEVLLHEHDIPCAPFPATVLACLPPHDYKIVLERDSNRLDLRHLPVLSIDPPGCKDIDDALHCVKLPNGNYQVGVHIADVTHYVKAGTAIDIEAANRSTSTYLVNKRLDMLPSLLTTDLCSLKGNVDRFAFSVLWELGPDASIINVDFHKTIIHSIAALTYQQAQALIDEPGEDFPNCEGKASISKKHAQADAVKRLNFFAKKLRMNRINAGALTLASPEVKFVLDSESLNPTDVQTYQLLEANALVEEFMLLANVTVAKKILRHFPTLSILRRHPAPNRSMFDSLISKAQCRGFAIHIEDSKRLADSLDDAILPNDEYFNKLLRILSTRCMSPAQYFCSGEYKPTDWHHYGLAAPVYTHFTSPIRRYADVCVHRLLAAAIQVEPLPTHLSSKSYLHDLAANMNRRHRSAQLAGRASVHLHTLLVFSNAGNSVDDQTIIEDAYVLDVQAEEGTEPSFTVIIPRYGIEGRVKLAHICADDDNLIRDPDRHYISYKKRIQEGISYNKEQEIDNDIKDPLTTTTIQVFDKVKVKISVKELQDSQKELILELISPHFGCSMANSNQKKKKKHKSMTRLKLDPNH
mmetsp:Transcript_14712/g.21010  ORF Transcript_14712/g.21010 Transcript_14712/m.21010 type:complete len:1218 (-) Transcript_14712:132-3785(-)